MNEKINVTEEEIIRDLKNKAKDLEHQSQDLVMRYVVANILKDVSVHMESVIDRIKILDFVIAILSEGKDISKYYPPED